MREVSKQYPQPAGTRPHFEAGAEWARAVQYWQLAAEDRGAPVYPGQSHGPFTARAQRGANCPRPSAPSPRPRCWKHSRSYTTCLSTCVVLVTYEALAARAAQYGLRDVEVRALIDMAHPLGVDQCAATPGGPGSRHSGSVPSRAIRSCGHTRGRGVWSRCWMAIGTLTLREACRTAPTELRQVGDRLALAALLIDYGFSSGVPPLIGKRTRASWRAWRSCTREAWRTPIALSPHWESQMILPWILLFLGEWGEALRTLTAAIAMAEKNGDARRVQTFRVYQAGIHFQAWILPGSGHGEVAAP